MKIVVAYFKVLLEHSPRVT